MLKKSLNSLLTALAGLWLLATPAGALLAGVDLPVLPKAKASAVPGKWECVEPTADMRRNHMDYLLHHRDGTMHQGIRTPQHSLKACIECHAVPGADGRPVSIKSREHFCNACHSYAAVTIDCWECHASRPAKIPPIPPLTKGGETPGFVPPVEGAGGISQASTARR